MRLAFLALSLGVLLAGEHRASAQDRAARTHYEAGSSYYDQGRYADALHEFEEAYRLSSRARKPALLYNIGLTQERLGQVQDAIGSFQHYLDGSPGAHDRATVQERIRTLQARLDSTTIALDVSEPRAHVQVDGEDRGLTPLTGPLQVSPGEHEVTIEKTGFHAFHLRVTVPAGERVSAQATLVPASQPVPVAQEPLPPTPVIEHHPINPPPEEHRGRTLPWILTGVAAAGAVGGTVLGLLALGKRNSANDYADGPRGAYDSARSDAKRLALFADISFGVAVLAGGTALILFLTGGRSDDAPAEETSSRPRRVGSGTLRPAPLLLEGGAGLALTGAL